MIGHCFNPDCNEELPTIRECLCFQQAAPTKSAIRGVAEFIECFGEY
jgi:hypothetical protein